MNLLSKSYILLCLSFGSGFLGATEPPSTAQNLAANEEEHEKDENPYGIGLAGVPALSYTSDFGFGFGVIGTLYKKNPHIKPYDYAIDIMAFMTTKWQHAHYVAIDAVEVGGLPLRIKGKVGFYATPNQNFCGVGLDIDCRLQTAEQAADGLQLAGSSRTDFLSRYYYMRYFEMFGLGQVRWRIHDAPHKIEVVGGWRGSYYLPGTWKNLTPYPNSLLTKTLDVNNQKGFASVLEAGFMFDGRDNEFSPQTGYWAEAMLRFSSPLIGSKWQYGGFNLTARGYIPLTTNRRLVLAVQGIIDGIIGDAALQEIVRVGNSMGHSAFGGAEIGRGLREQMFPGRIKVIEQTELRYTFPNFTVLKQRFAPGLLAFCDAGISAWQWQELLKASAPATRLPFLVGFGGGARLAWNENFIIRFDVGVSPDESYFPRYYLKVKHVF